MRLIAFVLVALLCFTSINAERQEKSLDRDGKYVMGWDVDTEKGEIIFDVKVESQGYVGFGLNQKADMANADIVIGGVDSEGKAYFADYHAVGKSTPILDESQDWTLLEAEKDSTHVFLKFKRELNTCDDEDDFIITKDTVTVIWSIGETDDLTQHIARGSNSINFLDPLLPPIDLEDERITKWEVRVNDTMPSLDTSYLCSFHKFDAFPVKHHSIGMNVFLENDRAVKHTHHFAAFNCIMDDMTPIQELVGKPALNCEDMRVLTELKPNCRDMLFGWGSGGQLVLLPEHVGVPVKENEVYYVMLEIHYDNPLEESGIQFTTGFDTYFSTELRENEGSIVMVGARILPSLIIPPDSENFVIAGHCSSEITNELIPPGGVNVVSVTAHSHLAGRKMRVRHFRDGKELPWLFDDQNYDFNYQQTRNLGQEVKFMPGDHLTTECTYDTTFRKEITLAGESTRDEMCHAFIFFYPKIRLNVCSSGIPLEFVFQAFGVESIDNSSIILDPMITKPDFLANQTFSQLLNDVEWTIPRRVDLEQKLRFNRHEAYYELIRNTNDSFPYDNLPTFDPRIYVKYPEFEEDYVPEVDMKCTAAVTNATSPATEGTTAENEGTTAKIATTTAELEPTTTEGNNPANTVFISCTFLLFSLIVQAIL